MTLSNYFALNVDPSQALPETYNYGLVLLSYLVAVLGSYAFLQFASRIAELRDAGLRYSWLVIGAIAMGGGIWAMHFIGMLAHILPIPVSSIQDHCAFDRPRHLGGVAHARRCRPVITTAVCWSRARMGAASVPFHYTGIWRGSSTPLVPTTGRCRCLDSSFAVLSRARVQVRQVITVELSYARRGKGRSGRGMASR